jgi:uncharacterized protein
MRVFADSSALVKLYVNESHSEALRSIPQPLAVSSLAFVEVSAALHARRRNRTASAEEVNAAISDLARRTRGTADIAADIGVVAVDDTRLLAAAELTAHHPLRALDAIQLACAIAARKADPGVRTVAAFDTRLRDAAAIEGFALLPAEL